MSDIELPVRVGTPPWAPDGWICDATNRWLSFEEIVAALNAPPSDAVGGATQRELVNRKGLPPIENATLTDEEKKIADRPIFFDKPMTQRKAVQASSDESATCGQAPLNAELPGPVQPHPAPDDAAMRMTERVSSVQVFEMQTRLMRNHLLDILYVEASTLIGGLAFDKVDKDAEIARLTAELAGANAVLKRWGDDITLLKARVKALMADAIEKDRAYKARVDEIAGLTKERDEALMLAEGPATLRELAAGFVVRGFAEHDVNVRADRLAALLRWLDSRGGLGFDAHNRIREALAAEKEPQG